MNALALFSDPCRTSPSQPAVRARLEVGIDVVGVIGKPLHRRCRADTSIEDSAAEGVNAGQSVHQGGTEGRADAVGTMAVIAAGVVAAKAVIGSGIHPAVDDLVELGLSTRTRRWRVAEG